ncbi:MAG: hypothetical protein HOQ12_09495 [Gemmatimonadaceae bacterium]|nr:hypothetical protein [Gemmatimonadaceae bacterium]
MSRPSGPDSVISASAPPSALTMSTTASRKRSSTRAGFSSREICCPSVHIRCRTRCASASSAVRESTARSSRADSSRSASTLRARSSRARRSASSTIAARIASTTLKPAIARESRISRSRLIPRSTAAAAVMRMATITARLRTPSFSRRSPTVPS